METSLTITSVSFRNFRNYVSLELQDLGRLVVIVGDNALGKTNIIEGLQLISMLDSFRKPSWEDVVRQGEDCAYVMAEFIQNSQKNHVMLEIRDSKRTYRLNEKVKRNNELVGRLPAVLFTPDDLQIIKGPAEQRRLLVDNLGCQLSRTFYDIKQDYGRTVKQKNSLLREEYVNEDLLMSWNRNLAKLGASLMSHRVALFNRLMKRAIDIYTQIAPQETLLAEYTPSWVAVGKDENVTYDEDVDMFTLLETYHGLEMRQRRALIGPHRDEIAFYINGKNARQFGSQGQQRSIALALKIAEVEVLHEVMGVHPILLLDDVMSEIDEGRRTILLKLIDTTTQTFITTTNLSYFDEETLKKAQVVSLPGDQENAHVLITQ